MTTLIGVRLTGRLVVFAGGGRATARRLPRFVAEGARVLIVAPELSAQTRALVHAHGLGWRPRRIRPRDLRGAWLVHAATGDAAVDSWVARRCEASRILCVAAGDGEHSVARLAAETRSGDTVVGAVSDIGVDPGRSARIRDAIAGMLDEGALPLRRRREAGAGRVDLVGGGPGPDDLLTLRARRLIAEADVVVADRLGPTGVLAFLDPGVEVIDVGKHPGHHPVPQDEIDRIIVARARAGQRVVRLKGGDPFVFGRGGEEVAACLAAGIPVDVVPGVSSAIAVPQAAGIPVTHRGTATGVHITNGHDAPTEATLAALRDPATTTVVLMGVAALPQFAAAALAAGADPATPVAIVESGHRDRQRTTRAPLGRIAAEAAAAGVRNPAVIVVGAVADERLLRPVADAAATQSAASASGANGDGAT